MSNEKLIAKIPCQLMTKEQTVALKLQEQAYLMIFPKSVLQRHGITAQKFIFEVSFDEEDEIFFCGTPSLEN